MATPMPTGLGGEGARRVPRRPGRRHHVRDQPVPEDARRAARLLQPWHGPLQRLCIPQGALPLIFRHTLNSLSRGMGFLWRLPVVQGASLMFANLKHGLVAVHVF